MPLVDPTLPKAHRWFIYAVTALLLLAVLVLGGMSLARSIAGFGRTAEQAGEFRSRADAELQDRFRTYDEEKTTIQGE